MEKGIQGDTHMVRMEDMQKLTRFVNTMLLSFVVLMAFFFAHYGVTYMVYHSIPTAAMYVWFYHLINIKRVDLYAAFVYIEIEIYMVAATICLGLNYGFHLYCFSLSSLSFYMYYLGKQLNTKKANPLVISAFLIVTYLICAIYVMVKGPVYIINRQVELAFLCSNAIAVFLCIIGYGQLILKMVLVQEDKLSEMAHTDRLTGLFNRHYMISHLEKVRQNASPAQWVAMVDIDGFKSINDTHGHNCGDYVLITLCRIMREVCTGCVIARWGGEEFLITSDGTPDPSILETLRATVESSQFAYSDQIIDVTITIGTSFFQPDQSLDSWIQSADNKLYSGKNSGKNQVVH